MKVLTPGSKETTRPWFSVFESFLLCGVASHHLLNLQINLESRMFSGIFSVNNKPLPEMRGYIPFNEIADFGIKHDCSGSFNFLKEGCPFALKKAL